MSNSICGIQTAHIIKPVAANLASMDDSDQADFMETFAGELRKQCGPVWCVGSQCAAITGKLSKEARQVLGAIAAGESL